MDVDRLGTYLQAKVAGFNGLISVQKFADGQSNPTYKLCAKSGHYVLRSKPQGILLKSAHAIDREFRVLTALTTTEVPVARPFHYCEDTGVIGTEFYIVQFLDGRVLSDPLLPGMTFEQRAAIYDQQNQTLVALHNVDIISVGMSDFGKPGNYFERQLSRWSRQYRESETGDIPAMNQLIDWLGANMVADDGKVSLVHGDYRLDNLMFAKDCERLIGVMDWELSTLGHPYADLAYQCMQWRLPAGPVTKGLGTIKRPSIGIPDEATYVALYCERRNLPPVRDWTFYVAFSFFRLAAILQGVMKRSVEGNASSASALEYGRLTSPLALQAMQIIEESVLI